MAEALGGADFGGELFLLFAQGAEITLDLQAVPELRGLAEERAKADRHRGGDGPFAQHDLVDCPGGHADGPGHGILGEAHGGQILLQQDFSGCDRWIHRL